jgi:hypothetical protein
MDSRFRLTPAAVVLHFKHRCDRLFRWSVVPGGLRNRPGIGWGVPDRPPRNPRPGIEMLRTTGDVFERRQLDELIAVYGENNVRMAGVGREGERERVLPMPLADCLAALSEPDPPPFLAQIELDLGATPAIEAAFLARFGLDPARVALGVARPDLLEVRPVTSQPASNTSALAPAAGSSFSRTAGPNLTARDFSRRAPGQTLRIWDFKATQEARHEHFIQVAFYSLLLETALEYLGPPGYSVDTQHGVIRSYKGVEVFELAPYRLALIDFLRHEAPALLATPAADAHFLFNEGCSVCTYGAHCRNEAEASHDLSRIAYITSASKRRLRAAGIHSHRELATLTPEAHSDLLADLRNAGHDLHLNLDRYIATANALADGLPRDLARGTLLMPRYEDIRVIISAEQDAVTGTVFALGIKVSNYSGDAERSPERLDAEHVFIATTRGDEVSILLPFLRTLNALLAQVDAANRAVPPVEADPAVQAAQAALTEAEEHLARHKADHPRIVAARPGGAALREERNRRTDAVKLAKAALKEAGRSVAAARRQQQHRLHFYLYDTLDLNALRALVERHLLDPEPPELLVELTNLIRLFPPESVLQDADTFRSIPGTVVVQALRQLVALPVPYSFDLRRVADLYRPRNAAGEQRGSAFFPRRGFGWEFSNQVAFERIHNVWNNEPYSDENRTYPPDAVLAEIERTVRMKLRAVNSVVTRLKQDFGERLLLRKEPFHLYDAFDPLQLQTATALRVFTLLEASLAELQVKALHSLPAGDRAAKLECIRDLRLLREELDGTLWFSFDPACRDARIEVGDRNLVLTVEAAPEQLLGEVDGELFNPSRWRHAPFEVDLVEIDGSTMPPRLRLRPRQADKLRQRIDLTQPLVLDKVFTDVNSGRVLDLIQCLAADPVGARHTLEIVEHADIGGWQPSVADIPALETALRARISASGADPDALLNPGQWRAWRGVFGAPCTLVWGPPGTGKTHTIAHVLVGFALAARQINRPLRILVTAFTHHAIVNVLRKLGQIAPGYGLGVEDLLITKIAAGGGHSADDERGPNVDLLPDSDFEAARDRAAQCVVIGATVWATYKAMKATGGAPRPWFDVVLIDEASQMKLPDALIALAASTPQANVILAGDDRQLPPIILGRYPEAQAHLLGSVFATVRQRVEAAGAQRAERTIFQLEENFRMNEPLTAYPREAIYAGRFFAARPAVRARLARAPRPADPVERLLFPEEPALLATYQPPRSFTARNPLEAELAADLVARLAELLIDERTGVVYTPEAFAAEGIAVLAPHRAQNSAIRQALLLRGFGTEARPMPVVDTVDKLQGQERDVVIVSYGVADAEYAEAEAEFLLSSNRFNVAATRARHKLIVLCAAPVLGVVPTDRSVLLDAMMLKEYRAYCNSGETQISYGELDLTVAWKSFEGSPSD